MTTKSEIIKPKTVRIYDLDDFEKLLKGLRVAACMITESHQVVDEASVLKRLSALTLNGPADGNCCSCCGVGPFETRAQQIAHYKNHWHTHNLKRKLYGKASLTLGQFNSRNVRVLHLQHATPTQQFAPPQHYITLHHTNLPNHSQRMFHSDTGASSGDVDTTMHNCKVTNDSSVSSSDSETEGSSTNPAADLFAAATRHCKAFYTNHKGKVFCIYRCILHHKKEVLSTDGEGYAWVERCQRLAIPGWQRWAILMVSGGHFAGAIFSGAVVVLHKTHHSYVSRRGQGQAQINRDQHGNAPRSAGASLRRYNQAQFLQHVQDIIAGWAQDLKGCSIILYRAVGSINQSALFGKNSPLTREDMRVRPLPFPTQKPTYKEVKRVHETVASVEVYETMELFQKALIASTSKTAIKPGPETGTDRTKKAQKSPSKPIDRAKSRERAPRELPTQIVSSEDEGPCFIDSETPVGWIKTLSEQSSNGVITNSRKDLLNDCAIAHSSESDQENTQERKEHRVKVKKKKKVDDKQVKNEQKKAPLKISANVKKMWKLILGKDQNSLETILEGFEPAELEAACNTQDPADGNTALHKAAIAEKPEMVTEILTAGGDPCIRNHALQTPYAASPHNGTRIAFRMFQAQFPDKYNYNKSQIPGPVTPEQIEQEKEKKAQQKKAKRQREKEKQAEKNKINKFLQMTDVQKVRADLMMCFLCGAKLPRPPFEYDSFQFCSIKCLQNHRNLRPLHKSA